MNTAGGRKGLDIKHASESWRRFLLLAGLTTMALAILLIMREDLMPAELLIDRHQALRDLITAQPFLSALAFTLFYALIIALAIPGGTVLSLGAGYLFGPVAGMALALCGATLGAIVTLFVVRFVAAEPFRRRLGGRFSRIREVFLSDPARHLLLLRLVPLFPFFAVNITIALIGVPTRMFLWTTVVGTWPSTAAYAFIGSGFGEQLEHGRLPGPELLLEPVILWPALVLVSLVLLAGRLRRDL